MNHPGNVRSTVGSSGPVRWGILGPGRIAERFLVGAALSSDAVMVAVGSRDGSRAESCARAHGIPRAYVGYEAVLRDPDVEVVYIALPNGLHHRWTMEALRAGKHVLCEKPYSRYPGEVAEAFDLAESRQLVLSEAFMWRHHAQARRILEILPELGRLEIVRATFSFIPEDATDIRLQAGLEGGSLMDVGCYCVSGARLVAGEEPRLAVGSATSGAGGVDVTFSGTLEFPSGLTAVISSGFTTDGRTLELIGSAGSIQLLDPWNASPAVIVRDGVRMEFEPQDLYQLEIDDVSGAIRGRREPLLGRTDALGQARTIEALYRSAGTGDAVAL